LTGALKACLIVPVVTITSIVLSSNETQDGDAVVPANPDPSRKWPLKQRERETFFPATYQQYMCVRSLTG